jgi:hypothetical protein
MNRIVITLNPIELRRFRKLQNVSGEAQNFWWSIARNRGLDPGSLVTIDGVTSGLPQGHDKYWCWPFGLKCKHKPEDLNV